MAKIFMTVVGTSNYSETEYQLGSECEKNRFVQKALLTMLTKKGEKFDKIVIFLTKEAKEKNWEKCIVRNKLPDGTFENVFDEGLKPFLEKNYPGIYMPVDIKYGENEKEIFELFNTMYDAIGENDEITFDITHGFRFIPFCSFRLSATLRSLKTLVSKTFTMVFLLIRISRQRYSTSSLMTKSLTALMRRITLYVREMPMRYALS